MNPPADLADLGLDAMLELTERLTALLADQARAFEQHCPQDAAASMPDVTRLANLYRAGSAKARLERGALTEADPDLRRRLLRATEAFEAVLDRQGRALAASKVVTEGLVKAIADEIAAKRAQAVGYGPKSALSTAATAITLNQRA
jgi:hypothetical protein